MKNNKKEFIKKFILVDPGATSMDQAQGFRDTGNWSLLLLLLFIIVKYL
jgi:hypothetical protein